ncbi:hypothetical protein SLS62_008366 [Diatrype stigma]|uniref:Uncharacterized protein n=1 Tax=Diatrype stigma TaxID=117547 RepID=A0AAN9UMM2_9PEZI
MEPAQLRPEIRGLLDLPIDLFLKVLEYLTTAELYSALQPLLAHRGLAGIVKVCLAYRNAKSGGSALHRACLSGDSFVLKKLVDDFGITVEVPRRLTFGVVPKLRYQTPLVHAIAGGHVEIVKFLVARGANVNAAPLKDGNSITGRTDGWYPIHWAVGCSTSAGDPEGVTAAARKGKEIISFLLDQGAVADQKSRTFSTHAIAVTPLDVAEKQGASKEVIELLVERCDQSGVERKFEGLSLDK